MRTPGSKLLTLYAPAPDAGLPVGLAVFARHDRHVVVADEEREVGVAGLEGDDHGVLAVGLHVGDGCDDRLGGGRRLLAAMMVDGGDDVLGGHLPPIVIRHALAQLEGPGGDIGRCLPALGQLADQRAVTGHLGQIAVVRVGHGDREAVLMGPRIEAVGGRAVTRAQAHVAALLGGACESDGQGERSSTGRAGLEESATGCSVHGVVSLRGVGMDVSRCRSRAQVRASSRELPGTCVVDVLCAQPRSEDASSFSGGQSRGCEVCSGRGRGHPGAWSAGSRLATW